MLQTSLSFFQLDQFRRDRLRQGVIGLRLCFGGEEHEDNDGNDKTDGQKNIYNPPIFQIPTDGIVSPSTVLMYRIIMVAI